MIMKQRQGKRTHTLEVGYNGKASTISKKIRLETTIENAEIVQLTTIKP